ncbi:hypothetical protein [Kitasatospora phosalacinea]|uniref:hypothetical protein n=1 Tax=Kitasatospora phosalacinea TaxID=2065 RepID=UPI00369A44FA
MNTEPCSASRVECSTQFWSGTTWPAGAALAARPSVLTRQFGSSEAGAEGDEGDGVGVLRAVLPPFGAGVLAGAPAEGVAAGAAADADGAGVAAGAVGAAAEGGALGVGDGEGEALGWTRLFHQSSIAPACCTPPVAAPAFGTV